MGRVETKFLVRGGNLLLTFRSDGQDLELELSPSDARLFVRQTLQMLQKLPRDVPDPTVDPVVWADRPEVACGTDGYGDVLLAFAPPGAASYVFTLEDQTWQGLASEIQRLVALPRTDRTGASTH